MRWTHGLRARLRLLFRRSAEERMEEEIRWHLEMETEKNVREGMSPAEARRRAVHVFGGVEGHKEAVREGRTLGWLGGLSLDLKLGFRMLRKYPGLTVVGGLAIAFAISVGAGTFELLSQIAYPSLPLPDGDRIVGVRTWDAASNGAQTPTAYDFAIWSEEVESIEDLGAFRTSKHNLIASGVAIRPVEVAEMSASGFRVARVPAVLGRALVDEDQAPGAAPVVVLGYDVWQRQFGGEPKVVGREIRLGETVHTVVGVMPESFAFPIAHQLWTPLRLSPFPPDPAAPARVTVFGRLPRGATLADARTELSAIGRRVAADVPETHEHLRPQVLPYAQSIMGGSGLQSLGLLSMNLFLVMLLVLVCGNVALLMFARAVSRDGEIVVRSALGASRGRIIAQLVAEALVLAGVAAAVGLAVTNLGIRLALEALEAEVTGYSGLPFWMRDRISLATVLYAGALTLVGALVAGVLPALKVTRGLGTRLRRVGAGGGGYRFGGVWTTVIAAQVAVTVAFPAAAFYMHREAARGESRDVGVATEEYLSARLAADPIPAAEGDADGSPTVLADRLNATARELERRLEADPAVLGVTFAGHLPRMSHPSSRIEVDEGGAAPPHPDYGYGWLRYTSVDLDYFEVLGAPILQGRGFHSGDLEPEARVVIVNRSFVDRVLGGRNPIGRHVRYLPKGNAAESDPAEEVAWYEIVGVVPDMGMSVEDKGIYHPDSPGAESPLHMAVHVRGDPAALAPRLRSLAAAVDPTVRLEQVIPLDQVNRDALLGFTIGLVILVSGVALLLSLAGIYAVMAFTVAQRTREIGIRVALGAEAGRIVAAIFRRPFRQVASGVVAGAGLVAIFPLMITMETISPKTIALTLGYALCMMAVCTLACIVPTRRALGVEPTEALRAE